MKTETIIVVGALGIVGYLIWQHYRTQNAAINATQGGVNAAASGIGAGIGALVGGLGTSLGNLFSGSDNVGSTTETPDWSNADEMAYDLGF
jgi:F0F1-type ATP synthase membrane subunit c/vacuolar-type H+-ATPase subunit K